MSDLDPERLACGGREVAQVQGDDRRGVQSDGAIFATAVAME